MRRLRSILDSGLKDQSVNCRTLTPFPQGLRAFNFPAAKTPLALPAPRTVDLGGGRVFSHFTDANGVTGITGIVGESLEVGQVVGVSELRFAQGTNSFYASKPGNIFVTELGFAATPGELNLIGVFGARQQFMIQFSEEAAFSQGLRVMGEVPERSIFSILGGQNLQGNFTITRVR